MSLFKKSKQSLSSEVREKYSSPSFSYQIGPSFIANDAKEAREIIEKNNRPVVLLFPGINLFEYPSEWAKALSYSSFLIIHSPEEDDSIKAFIKRMENKVFSPVQKTIGGVITSSSREEAEGIAESMGKREWGIITIYSR